MEEKVVRKTTVKKSVRKTPVRVATVPATTVRKTVASVSARKAPSRFVSSSPIRKRSSLLVFVLCFVLLGALTGVSALIGLSDKGQLDVSSTIAKRKEKASPEEKQKLEAVPTEQAQASTPNGGLVGMGQPTAPAVAPQPVSTSTKAVASTSKASVASSSAKSAPKTRVTPTGV